MTLVWKNSNSSLVPPRKQPSNGATQSSSSVNTDHVATRKDILTGKNIAGEGKGNVLDQPSVERKSPSRLRRDRKSFLQFRKQKKESNKDNLHKFESPGNLPVSMMKTKLFIPNLHILIVALFVLL